MPPNKTNKGKDKMILYKKIQSPAALGFLRFAETGPAIKALGLVALLLFSPFVRAVPVDVVFDGTDPTATVESNSLSQTAGGVTMTLSAYQLEFDGARNETVFGPSPTRDDAGRPGFNWVNGFGMGFVATPSAGFDITQSDRPGGGLIIPGFDSFTTNLAESIEWLQIVFSAAVDINYVDVDDSSNFDRSIWVAALSGAFDYSAGLSEAIAGSTVLNSRDDATDGAFRHSFAPITNVTSLLIGAAPDFNLGQIEARTRSSSFFITGLGIDNRIDLPTTVPEPSTFALFCLGLLGFGLTRKLMNA